MENQDFVKLHKKVELSKTGQVAIEYFITLDKTSLLGLETALPIMILLKIKTLFGFPIKLLKTQRAVRICGKPRLCDFFRKFGKRSPTPRIRPHPRQDFSTWIKNRIERYEFVENKDYISFPKKRKRKNQ